MIVNKNIMRKINRIAFLMFKLGFGDEGRLSDEILKRYFECEVQKLVKF